MLKKFLRKLISPETIERYFIVFSMFVKNTKRKSYRKAGKHTELFGPLYTIPSFVELDDWTRLQGETRVTTSGGILRVKKFSAVGADCIFVPGSHVPTVGLPQFLSVTHVNDRAGEIVVEEDVWVGTRCTFLERAHVGRGAVVGACSLVNKEVPPYAVVAGSPAKVIAVRFSLEQILQHEAILYPPEERTPREQLEALFETTFKGLRTIGTSSLSPEDAVRLAKAKAKYEIPDYSGR